MKSVIYINTQTHLHADWVLFNDENQVVQSVLQGDINQFAVGAKNSDIFVIVPGQDILLTDATLPKLSRQRLLQALPFALEEQLIDDVTHLHFAIADYQSDGTLPVAIVANEKMQAWLQIFSALNLSPRAFIPSEFLLPATSDQWQINISDNECIVRTGKFSGFVCEKDTLNTLIELKLTETEQKPVLNETHFSMQQLLEKTGGTLSPQINLLQGVYQPKIKGTKIKTIWILGSLLILAWAAFAIFGNLVSLFILEHHSDKIESAINQIYKRNFPQATSIIAPRQRMTEKLHTLSGQAGKNNFLVLIAILGKSLADAPKVHIQNLDYRDQIMTIEVKASAFENLDALTKSLTAKGLSVKQQNAATEGTEVKATILVRGGLA